MVGLAGGYDSCEEFGGGLCPVVVVVVAGRFVLVLVFFLVLVLVFCVEGVEGYDPHLPNINTVLLPPHPVGLQQIIGNSDGIVFVLEVRHE